ncbi:MAG TPA: CRISPR-associated endonuclease Cas3'' [Eoetvoesiella sp.]
MIQVAELAEKNASPFNAGRLAATAGLLHDLGKYTIKFQERLSGAPIQVNHSTWGAKVAIEQYGLMGWLMAYGIAGHHAGLANGSGFDGERTALSERLRDPDLPLLETIWKQEVSLPNLKELAMPGAPFIPNAQHKNFHFGFLTRMLFSALVDADYLDTERYYDQFESKGAQRTQHRMAPRPNLAALRDELDIYMRGFNSDTGINHIRSDILAYARQQAALPPGVFSMAVPTGGGKTLASLAFALDHAIVHGQRRVIFVIPFTSIVEQNAAVFRKALGRYGEDAVLEHHSAFTPPGLDKRNPERYQAQEKLRLAMENWDAPIVVTTAVQFFESLFAAQPAQCRKLHNISNSVVVLDEVQTIPLHVLRPAVAALDELARNYRSSIMRGFKQDIAHRLGH